MIFDEHSQSCLSSNGVTDEVVHFDFDAIDRNMGHTRNSTEDDVRAAASEVLSQVLGYCWGDHGEGSVLPMKTAVLRFVAFTAGLRPELLKNQTYSQIGAQLGVTKAAVSKTALAVEARFGIKFARSRQVAARAHMAQAMTRSHSTRQAPKRNHVGKAKTYLIELRPVPGNWRASGEQRVKALLKIALRSLGLRCITIRESTEKTEAKEAKP